MIDFIIVVGIVLSIALLFYYGIVIALLLSGCKYWYKKDFFNDLIPFKYWVDATKQKWRDLE